MREVQNDKNYCGHLGTVKNLVFHYDYISSLQLSPLVYRNESGIKPITVKSSFLFKFVIILLID